MDMTPMIDWLIDGMQGDKVIAETKIKHLNEDIEYFTRMREMNIKLDATITIEGKDNAFK